VACKRLSSPGTAATVSRGESVVKLDCCTLQYISEAVVLIREKACVELAECTVLDSPVAFLAGDEDGEELKVSASKLHVRSVWFDQDRPRRLIMDETNLVALGEVNLNFSALRQNQNPVLDADLPEIELEEYRATNVY